MLFHVRIARFSGGFVGVDVFFVLSGFLITRLLLRESRQHRHDLAAPLLGPASPAAAAGVVLWSSSPPSSPRKCCCHRSPSGRWRPTPSPPAASSINFVFAARLGDYFASQLGRRPRRCCISGRWRSRSSSTCSGRSTLLALHRRPRQYRRLVTVMMIVVAIASFIACLWMTRTHPTGAFYLLAGADVGARRRRLVAVAGSAWRLVSPTARGSRRVGRGRRGRGRGADVRRLGRVPRLGSAAARARHRAHRRSVAARDAAWFAPVAVLRHRIAAMDRAPLVRDLPVALAGSGSRRGEVGTAVARPAVRRDRRRGSARRGRRCDSIEDPVRHSTWVASRSDRGLVLGASLSRDRGMVGAISLAMPRRLDHRHGRRRAGVGHRANSTTTTFAGIIRNPLRARPPQQRRSMAWSAPIWRPFSRPIKSSSRRGSRRRRCPAT